MKEMFNSASLPEISSYLARPQNEPSGIRRSPGAQVLKLVQNLEPSRRTGLVRDAIESSGRNVLAILLLLGASGTPPGGGQSPRAAAPATKDEDGALSALHVHPALSPIAAVRAVIVQEFRANAIQA